MSARALVLVADDYPDGREIAAEVLEHEGFRTAGAATGPEALAQARALRPDVLLLDLWLPGMDGWEVAQRLKADPATRGIKIVALTAHTERAALERARQAGCDAVLTKPCLPGQLVEEVRRLLDTPTPLPQDAP